MGGEESRQCQNNGCDGAIEKDGCCGTCGRSSEAETDADGLAIADDWENKLLCSDEDCFGVVGPDGRCRECGKSVDKGL